MGKIEEIHDDPAVAAPGEPTDEMIAKAMQEYTLKATQNGSIGPAAMPGMDQYKNMTSDEILADLNKTPLFMTELEDNDELAAFKALAYEGPPSEVAENFKEQGNDTFKARRWADAKEFYTKGINVLLAEERKRKEDAELKAGGAKLDVKPQTPEEVEEAQKEIALQTKLLEALLGNRSACHVPLKNYRSATQDCAAVLRHNPKNIKAYYRCAYAFLELGKIAEADDMCARGLSLDPEHKYLKALAGRIITKNEEILARKRKEEEAQRRKQLERYTLLAAIKARGIRTRTTEQPPEMEDACVRLVPDPADPTSSLVFPTVLLYPLHLQSDFIKEFGETETVGAHLDYILAERLPWDQEGEYAPKGVECYMETATGGLIKVGRNVTLLKVLSSGSVELVDEVVRIFVVPKGKAAAWIEDFKMKKAAEKGGKK
jgi:tetratricopeptide (TPR) repeat protein